MVRALPLVIAMAIFATAAAAQEAIATAAGGPAGDAPAATTTNLLHLGDRIDRGDDIVRSRGPCGGPATTPDGKPDRSVHGEVFAAVGTRGYREAGGAACIPLGDHTAATIAVDAGQINTRSGWRK
jgi:hypothetical protein